MTKHEFREAPEGGNKQFYRLLEEVSKDLSRFLRHDWRVKMVGAANGYVSIFDIVHMNEKKPRLYTYLCSNPKLLAILVLCMKKDRLDVKWGVHDIFAGRPIAMLFIGCTHGHTAHNPAALASTLTGTLVRKRSDQLCAAAHGTYGSAYDLPIG